MNKPINILQVIPSLAPGGISSVVMNWLRNIDQTQYQFDFIVFNDGPLRLEIEKLGAKIHLLPTMRQAPWQYYRQVRAILNGHKSYHAIHIHNSFKNVAMLWLAKQANIPLRICHSHTSGLENKQLSFIFNLLRKLTISGSNVHLACGKKAGQFLYHQAPFKVINNAINVSQYSCIAANISATKKDFNLPTNKHLVAHVGRFSTVKNHQFIVELAKDKALKEDIHFVLIGEGPLKSHIAEQICEYQLHDKITLLPATDRIADLLPCMTGFIMPSLFEGVSVALLEAQAASLSCLISNTIAPECDMRLGLIHFLDLQTKRPWLEHLNNLQPTEINDVDIHHAFNQQGYSIQSVLTQLYAIYNRTRAS